MFTFKKEARRAGLQGVLDGLNLAGNHAEDLCLNPAAAQSCHSWSLKIRLAYIHSASLQYSRWLIKKT